MTHPTHQPDPRLDLELERIVDVKPELVWAAWTQPQHLKHWFTPAPWKTVDCEIDLRPGGIFRTVMQSPEGQNHPNIGCYLEIVENRRLAWTNVLGPGFRPQSLGSTTVGEGEPFGFTAVVSMEPHARGTRYTALVMHQDEGGRKQHEQMGFHDGWGTALEQLVAYMKKTAGTR
ncbi:MAG TPA: SRPBCC family protein [Usitatibacteraceae bacterium]